jgi:hypothetical protein
MQILQTILNWLVSISLLINLVRAYLAVNKVWYRKHLSEVSQSISVASVLLGMCVSIPFAAREIVNHDVQGVIDRVMSLGTATFYLLLGTGFWLKDRPKISFAKLVRRALLLEKQEVTRLLHEFSRPKGADQIMDVLYGVACVDKELSPKEREMLGTFAAAWGLEINPIWFDSEQHQSMSYTQIKNKVEVYLAISPPQDQVLQLLDLIRFFVKLDNKISKEEALMLPEISGMLSAYAARKGQPQRARYSVLLVPQTPQQQQAIRDLLPQAEPTEIFGGQAFLAGHYYHAEYAQTVCQEYRQLNIFATIEEKTV